jgi:hypothetical protein
MGKTLLFLQPPHYLCTPNFPYLSSTNLQEKGFHLREGYAQVFYNFLDESLPDLRDVKVNLETSCLYSLPLPTLEDSSLVGGFATFYHTNQYMKL